VPVFIHFCVGIFVVSGLVFPCRIFTAPKLIFFELGFLSCQNSFLFRAGIFAAGRAVRVKCMTHITLEQSVSVCIENRCSSTAQHTPSDVSVFVPGGCI